MINIPMTPAQFDAATRYFNSSESVNTAITWTSATTGKLTTAQITANFSYDQSKDTMSLTNEKRHGLAAFASDQTIIQHMEELLKWLPADNLANKLDPSNVPDPLEVTANTTTKTEANAAGV